MVWDLFQSKEDPAKGKPGVGLMTAGRIGDGTTVDDRNPARPHTYYTTIVPRISVSKLLQDLCFQPYGILNGVDVCPST